MMISPAQKILIALDILDKKPKKKLFRSFNVRNLKKERFDKLEIPREWLARKVYLAGGSLRTLVDKDDEVADYDLFFGDEFSLEQTLEILNKEAEIIFKCPEGKLFTYKWKDLKIQCVCNGFHKSPQDVIITFDFNACCAVLDWFGKELIISNKFVKDVKTKNLSMNVLTFPIATIKRVIKYSAKGYRTGGVIREIVSLLNPNLTKDEMVHYID